jgi:secreted trypsin-like serine protease
MMMEVDSHWVQLGIVSFGNKCAGRFTYLIIKKSISQFFIGILYDFN